MVRNYMHVFERYSNPLKSARLRQYLHEGAEGWYMPVVAEAVPSLVHVALFLFFLGLADSLLSLNTTVGSPPSFRFPPAGFFTYSACSLQSYTRRHHFKTHSQALSGLWRRRCILEDISISIGPLAEITKL